MTQTSPKPADHNTNGHNPKSLTSAYIGSHTTPSREKLDANRIESASRPKPSQAPFWKQLRLSWENLSFRSKLTLLLLTAAAVPIFILTQINVTVSDRHSKEALQKLLHTDSLIQDSYFKQLQEFSRKEAARMAAQVKEAAIDLNDPRTVLLHSSELNKLVNNFGEEASFVILTNAQGKTIAQKIQILEQDFSKAPSMPTEKASTQSSYRPIAVTLGLNLVDVSIVKNALANQRPLEGAELLKGEVLARLGLAPQAYITPRPQPIQGLSEPKQPAPEGTYDIEQGKVGVVVMDVHPINVNNQVVGTAIIGTLLNHNYKIVDQLKQQYEIPTATIFAEDFRVSTNVPYFDPKTKALDNTRAIGIRAAREVTNPVLNQGQVYFGPTNIGGVEYMGAYRPLYDHQKELNPIQAKPMGMLSLAITKTEVENQLNAQRWMGYSVGVVLLVLLSLVAIPVADTFSRPVRRLSRFARKVGTGEQGVRLATTERQDEIGVLSQELNQMAASIEANLTAERQQAEQAKLLTDTSFNIAQSLNSDDIFNTAVQKIRQFLKTDRMVVYGFNENWQGTVIAESVAEGWPRALGAKIDDPCFADKYVERYRKGRVQPTDNIYAAGLNECHIKQLEQFAVKANLVAPIVQAGQLLGLLIAHHCSGPRAWQQDEIDLFAQLANQVGFALDRVNFLEQQRKAKEKIQQRALELLMEVEPVSSGDLTIRASVTEDEIGTIADSYNATIDSLRKIVIQVQTAAKIVAGTTSNSEVSVQELSKEALRQAEEIAVALDRIQQMSNSIRDVAATAKLAAAAVQQATQTVEAGDAAMNQTVEGILAIRETVAATSMKVKQLGESSQKISKVVSLVGRFAAQTNLLALKASIEAARAGEEGRGFAVLADEVRSLASQSAQATAEIESLVAAIQTETNSVVAAMEAGSEQVVTGTKLVDETRQSLNKIADASAQISALVQAIASTAVVQYEASESVTETMSDVAAIAQHTSNEATVVSASFKELLAVAQQLQASVGQFKVS